MCKDLYKILGIPRNASRRQLRDAYRTLAKRYHPDTGAGSSEEKFREIRDAYETLSDPARKAAYDSDAERSALPISKWTRSAPRGYREFRNDPSHIDLSDVFDRRPHPETTAGTRPAAEVRTFGGDPWGDLEFFLRYILTYEDPDW